MKALIVGPGRVGQALQKLLLERGDDVLLLANQKQKIDKPEWKQGETAEIVFLCLSTKDDGQAALFYIESAIALGKPIVTCEKGALANYWSRLRPELQSIGYRATVGGGSHLLSVLNNPLPPIKSVVGVINATLDFVLASSSANSYHQAINRAKCLGLCEPGDPDWPAVAARELKDIKFKICILYNHALLSPTVLEPGLVETKLDLTELLQSIRYRRPRLVLKIDHQKESRGLLVFRAEIASWHVRLELLEEQPLHHAFSWPTRPAYNCLFVEREDGTTSQISGPGAGPRLVAQAMLAEALILLKRT